MDPLKPTKFGALFKQISSPTVVTHSAYCNLLNPHNRNLVLVRGTTLDVYDVRRNGECEKFNFITSASLYEVIEDIAVVRFYGDQLDSILLSFKEAKVAAMNFDINTYDLKTCSLHTYELPSLKGGRSQFAKPPMLRVDPLQRCAVMLVYDRFLAVLPFRRADALTASEHMPEPQNAPTVDAAWQNKATAPILSSFTTFLSTSTGEHINNVIDIQFLFGFYEPTLFVLYEPVGTWTGRVSARRDTCCIVALSLNLQKRTNPVIWFQEQLPFDCHTVVPIPMPVGGVIILATNSIIYLKQTIPSRGLPLNCYAKISTDFPLRQSIPECGPLSFDGSRGIVISPSQVLIATREGNFYTLTLLLEKATNTATKLILMKVGVYCPPETMTLLENNLIFVGSSIADSALMRYTRTSKTLDVTSKTAESVTDDDQSKSPISKRPRILSTSESVNHDDEDVELYGSSAQETPSQPIVVDEFSFETLATLRNIGPISSITVGEVPCLATGQTDPTDEALTQAQLDMAHTELIACVARPGAGASPFQAAGIVQLHRSVRACGITAFELPEYSSLWSLYGPPVGSFVDKEDAPNAVVEVDAGENNQTSMESVIRVDEDADGETDIKCAADVQEQESNDVDENMGSSCDVKHPLKREATEKPAVIEEIETPVPAKPPQNRSLHSYLLLTRKDSSMILEVGEEIVELEVSGFKTTETTVLAANLGVHAMRRLQAQLSPQANGTKTYVVGRDYPYIVQVSPTTLRLLDGPHLLEDVHLTTESRVSLAAVADPFVLVSTEMDEFILVSLRSSPLNEAESPSDSVPLRLPSESEAVDVEGGQVHAVTDSFGTQKGLPFSRYLEISRPQVAQNAVLMCFCLYHDDQGRLTEWLFNNVNPNLLWKSQSGGAGSGATGNEPNKVRNIDVDGGSPSNHLSALDEEDILLYGEVIDVCKKERSAATKPMDQSESGLLADSAIDTEADEPPKRSAHFAFMVFSTGVMQIYSVPEFTCLYEVRNFIDLPTVLSDCRGLPESETRTRFANFPSDGDDTPPTVREVTVFTMGQQADRPILFVRTTREVVCYEALCSRVGEALPLTPVPAVTGSVDTFTRCPLMWRRLPLPCPLLAPGRLRSDPRVTDIQAKLTNKSSMLRAFEDIGGHRGVFVCGTQPMWMFCTRLGHIRIFPHTIDGAMTSFAPLNTTSCSDGFVYFTHANEMKLATLPPGYSYDEELGINTIPVEGCPRFIQYHLESKTYVVVSSTEGPCQTFFRLNSEGNKEEENVERPASCVLPTLEKFKFQVIAALPNTKSTDTLHYGVVPNSEIGLEPFEAVTCLVTAQLASEQTFHGTKDYLALGANLSYGEEIPVRGRILLVDIIEVVPEPGKPLTRHKVKTVFDGDQKGPITALASCQGYLISAVGQKIYIWALKNGELEGVAFVDTDLYIHSLLCVKNLILAADVLKSIQLLRFQSSMRVLSLVSRDSSTREVFTANFFVDGPKLGFLVTDKVGNLVVFNYDPIDSSSCSGRRLVHRADIRLPSTATACLRVANRFRHPLLSIKAIQTEVNELRRTGKNAAAVTGSDLIAALEQERTRQSVYFGTRTGAIYLVTPIREKMLNRLRIVEKNLVQCVGCSAGLIPRACRQYNQPFPELENPSGNVSDGDLVWRYLMLPHGLRLEVAKKSGQSLESIMDDIAEVNAITLHF